MTRRTLPHLSHWGAFRVTVDGDRIVGGRGPPRRPGPSPLLANFLDGVHHRGPRRAARGPPRLARARPGPRRAPRARTTSSRSSWAEALDLVAGELRARAGRARQRVDLRRLLRLGQRRPLPPRAEPAAPVPQLHRRLHRRRSTATRSARSEVILPHVVGGADEVLRTGDDVEGDPRAHRARRRLRRHEREERVGEPGRRDPPHAARRASPPPAARGLAFELFSPLRSDLPDRRRGDVAPGACPAPTPR